MLSVCLLFGFVFTHPYLLSVMHQMGTDFPEMSSWTALTWYTVIKTAFKTKNTGCPQTNLFWGTTVVIMGRFSNFQKRSLAQSEQKLLAVKYL